MTFKYNILKYLGLWALFLIIQIHFALVLSVWEILFAIAGITLCSFEYVGGGK